MKQIFSMLALGVLLFSCGSEDSTSLDAVAIIPQPTEVKSSSGSFQLTDQTAIYIPVESDEWKTLAASFTRIFQPATGFAFPTTIGKGKQGISFAIANDKALGKEGYQISIDKKSIAISSNSVEGASRAIQTLRQLLPASIESKTTIKTEWKIPAGIIRDFPRYGYRGAMLDVARHFFNVEEVKRFIDMMALYKMNYLHLHLSDDQGWRIEIKSWPNLSLHGGKTEVGGGEGGYYTQEQYKEIIRYAQDQYITVVPEIDMPGHINSALASYGELNGGTIVPVEGRFVSPTNDNPILDGKTKPTELYTGIEVGWSTLRLEKEATFRFVEDVIREISALTPGPYFHIGGDEARVTKKEDYIAFVNRFQQIVKANGKTMLGWEEIAQAQIEKETVVQHWHSSKYAFEAVEKGGKLLMSPSKKAYLDMSYDSTSSFGLHWAAYIEVDSAYMWNPDTLLPGISSENILGVESPLWSETIATMDELEYLLFPRLPGYAEIGWSQESARNWDEYKVRLGRHGPRMKQMNIDFYQSKLVPWEK